VKEALKETHFLPFFCACRHPTNCQGQKAKICGVSGSGDESLASKRGTKCTQKRHVQKFMGSVILQFSSMNKVGRQNM
jgi:hypothetical protein